MVVVVAARVVVVVGARVVVVGAGVVLVVGAGVVVVVLPAVVLVVGAAVVVVVGAGVVGPGGQQSAQSGMQSTVNTVLGYSGSQYSPLGSQGSVGPGKVRSISKGAAGSGGVIWSHHRPES